LIDFEPSTTDERRSRMVDLPDEDGVFDQTKRYVALSQQARVLAVAFSKSHRVRLQSLVDGHELTTIRIGDFDIDGIDLTEDAGKLAVVNTTGEIRVWDVASQTILASLPPENFVRRLVRFSPRGDVLAFAYDPLDRTAMWDFTGHAGVRVFEQSKEEDSVTLAFTPDGKLLATSGDDRLVKFWDVASGKQAFSLSGHQGRITAIAFSPDGRTLATGSEDLSLKLWDLSTRQQLLTLHGHTAAVVGLFFRPDNQQLISIGRFDHDYCDVHIWETKRD
jgi:WD40 repeat protein